MAEVEARASRRARLELEEFERGGLVWERGGRAANLKACENQRRGEKEAKEETKSNDKEAKTNQKKRKKKRMRKCGEEGGTEETNSRQSHSLRWHAIMVDVLMHWGERCCE